MCSSDLQRPVLDLDPGLGPRPSIGLGLDTEQDQSYIAKATYLKARNSYYQAIKKAKRDHWNSFLEKEDPKSIFRALAYTKPGPSPKAWWTPELRELRKAILQKQRAISNQRPVLDLDPGLGPRPSIGPRLDTEQDQSYIAKATYLMARNSYFQAIKKAKRDH